MDLCTEEPLQAHPAPKRIMLQGLRPPLRGSLEIARKMLADGVDINLIMKYSGHRHHPTLYPRNNPERRSSPESVSKKAAPILREQDAAYQLTLTLNQLFFKPIILFCYV